jgi:hypothetical protein
MANRTWLISFAFLAADCSHGVMRRVMALKGSSLTSALSKKTIRPLARGGKAPLELSRLLAARYAQ